MRNINVAITGASGAIYAQRLLTFLEESSEVEHINLIISGPGRQVVCDELGIDPSLDVGGMTLEMLGRSSDKIELFHPGDIGASLASGSYPVDGMVIIPCSASSLSTIASGATRNLIHRAADVTLKEGRKLVLVFRETPLSLIHLENMLRLKQAGAVIMPAMPAFYHKPGDIISLVDHFVFRVMDHLELPHSKETVWTGKE